MTGLVAPCNATVQINLPNSSIKTITVCQRLVPLLLMLGANNTTSIGKELSKIKYNSKLGPHIVLILFCNISICRHWHTLIHTLHTYLILFCFNISKPYMSEEDPLLAALHLRLATEFKAFSSRGILRWQPFANPQACLNRLTVNLDATLKEIWTAIPNTYTGILDIWSGTYQPYPQIVSTLPTHHVVSSAAAPQASPTTVAPQVTSQVFPTTASPQADPQDLSSAEIDVSKSYADDDKNLAKTVLGALLFFLKDPSMSIIPSWTGLIGSSGGLTKIGRQIYSSIGLTTSLSCADRQEISLRPNINQKYFLQRHLRIQFLLDRKVADSLLSPMSLTSPEATPPQLVVPTPPSVPLRYVCLLITLPRILLN